MKKLVVTIIISSLLMIFYLSYINIQITESLVQTESIRKTLLTEKINNSDDLNYAMESITNSNHSINVNVYLLFFFILINIISCIIILFKSRTRV
jgi:hypothetical protein